MKISKLGKVALVAAVSASLALPTLTSATAASKFATATSASQAGGIAGHRLAIVACPIILGHDSLGTLGHLDDKTIAEVVSGDLFNRLRLNHAEGNFEGTFCQLCALFC